MQTVANSFIAMHVLTAYGLGSDAVKVVRSMFESAVVLAAFDHFPGLIQDFIDFRWIKKMMYIRHAKGTDREAFITPEREREIQKHYDQVLPRFTNKHGQPLSSWYRHKLRDLCEKVDKDSAKMPWAISHYSNLYRFSSELMHGDIVGWNLKSIRVAVMPKRRPPIIYVTESLMSGHWMLAIALSSYASIAVLPKAQSYRDELLRGWEEVWGEGSLESGES